MEQRDETGNRRGELRTKTNQGGQETEQEECEQRDESGDRKQNGENLKDCAGDFVVFTHESRVFSGRIADLKKCGSVMELCNMYS